MPEVVIKEGKPIRDTLKELVAAGYVKSWGTTDWSGKRFIIEFN